MPTVGLPYNQGELLLEMINYVKAFQHLGRVTEFVLLAGNRLTTVGKLRLPTETFVAELLMIRSEDEIVSSLIRIDTTFIGSKQWNNIFVGKLYRKKFPNVQIRFMANAGSPNSRDG
ncbi:hypothetical protein Tsp_08345 [Trichinella spiralis]|uniref:hypothetical protein n=1 Tax=Trichinella spiralis TaxID=6334 RepID=UPI0001EFD0F3|nr:hypothetical protein Tsp_08345 [Trichinella spiralis]